jgi:hypothetical protein
MEKTTTPQKVPVEKPAEISPTSQTEEENPVEKPAEISPTSQTETPAEIPTPKTEEENPVDKPAPTYSEVIKIDLTEEDTKEETMEPEAKRVRC